MSKSKKESASAPKEKQANNITIVKTNNGKNGIAEARRKAAALKQHTAKK